MQMRMFACRQYLCQTSFDGEEMRCGDKFQHFYFAWTTVESNIFLWDDCIVTVGHNYFLIGIGGMAVYQQLTVNWLIVSLKKSDVVTQRHNTQTPVSEQQAKRIIGSLQKTWALKLLRMGAHHVPTSMNTLSVGI